MWKWAQSKPWLHHAQVSSQTSLMSMFVNVQYQQRRWVRGLDDAPVCYYYYLFSQNPFWPSSNPFSLYWLRDTSGTCFTMIPTVTSAGLVMCFCQGEVVSPNGTPSFCSLYGPGCYLRRRLYENRFLRKLIPLARFGLLIFYLRCLYLYSWVRFD